MRAGSARPFSVVEATIAEMRTALQQHRVTSHELVRQYLERIGMYEDKLHAAITVNPNALKEADERDRERDQHRQTGRSELANWVPRPRCGPSPTVSGA